MKNYIALLFATMFINAANASYTISHLPPDSTATIVEKTAAAYLIEEGKGMFNDGRVRDALSKFREAAKKDVTSWKAAHWIARCHYELNNYGFALKYAKDAILLNNLQIDRELYEILAESYHRLGSIDTAIVYYEDAIKYLPALRAKELNMSLKLEQARFAKVELAKNIENKRIHIENNINSGYHDYSPVLFNNGKTMYFTSRRSNTTGGQQSPGDQLFFEDIYIARWDEELKDWDSISNRIGRINGKGFESISYISEDGLLAYLTINNDGVNDVNIKTKSSDIAEIKWTKQGQWSNPKLIKNLNSTFYDGNATITDDGMTMYLVSERNGQSKMSDIYVSYKTGNSWSKPVALPAQINSKGRETTPYITGDGRYLFFSSNGHKNSIGGYDVYVVERIGNSWGEVKNLGSTINTVNDDFGFKIYEKAEKAYINGMHIVDEKASLDIFEFQITLEEILNNLQAK